MGAAKLRASKGPADYFLATLFAPEIPLPAEEEFVVIHEVGHAIANIILDYPIEFMSIKWTMNDTLSGFTKNTPEAKTSAEAEMRANNAHRALQLAAIQFAGPLSEYKARVRRYADTKSISYSSRNDKMDAFRICYANAIYAATTLRSDTGEIDFSPKVLQGQLTAWAKWKNDAYALAKSVLESPAASSASERISTEVTRRLSRGVEVRIPASEIQTALDSPVSVRIK